MHWCSIKELNPIRWTLPNSLFPVSYFHQSIATLVAISSSLSKPPVALKSLSPHSLVVYNTHVICQESMVAIRNKVTSSPVAMLSWPQGAWPHSQRWLLTLSVEIHFPHSREYHKSCDVKYPKLCRSQFHNQFLNQKHTFLNLVIHKLLD